MDSKNYHFHLFWQCAWREKCIFASFFYNFRSGSFTVIIFHIIFHSIFHFLLFVSLPNTQKWAENEFENGLKMAPRMSTASTLTSAVILHVSQWLGTVAWIKRNARNIDGRWEVQVGTRSSMLRNLSYDVQVRFASRPQICDSYFAWRS